MAITKIGTPELFDFSATNTALQLPTGDTASRPSAPSAGEWRFNSELKYVEFWDGGEWRQIDTEAPPNPDDFPSQNFNVNTYFGTGATQTIDAKFNEAANFNGNNSQINLPDSIGTAMGNNNFSVSFWVYLNSASRDEIYLSITRPYDFYVRRFATGNIYLNLGTLSYDTGVSLGTGWHHIAVTKSSSSGSILYLDNNATADSSKTGNIGANSIANSIGNYNGSGFVVDGKIDQVRIFNTAITALQVTDLYTNETTTTAATLNFPVGAGCIAAYQLDGDASDVGGTYGGVTTNIGYTGLKFRPDMIWIKNRAGNQDHVLFDSVRGVQKVLRPNTSDAEFTGTGGAGQDYLSAFNSNGFTVGDATNTGGSGGEYVAWCWYAPTSESVSASGSILASTIKKNVDAGFSIVQYDVASQSSSQQISHGLGVAPKLIIDKIFNTSGFGWTVYSQPSGTGKYLTLNAAGGVAPDANFCSVVNDTIFQSSYTSQSNTQHIAYCFADIAGYQKVGSYTGNSSTSNIISTEITAGDGGFEPAFVIIKAVNSGDNWIMLDNKRLNGSFPYTNVLYPNLSNSELANVGGNGEYSINFLTNGFQLTEITAGYNQSGEEYLYLAIAADKDSSVPTLANSFTPTLYTGNGATQNIYTPFAPDFTWIKNRNDANGHAWFDSVRSAGRIISSNSTVASSGNPGDLLGSFNPNGFQVNRNYLTNTAYDTTNGSSSLTYVSWNWKAGGLPTINNDGSTTSIVSANQAAGFSIVKYIGTGSTATIGHGLVAAPGLILVKKLTGTSDWPVYSSGLTSAAYRILLNSTVAEDTTNDEWNSTDPTTVSPFVFSVGNGGNVSDNGQSFIAYCFADIAGYQKVGSYTGTGATGNSIYTTDNGQSGGANGFEPSFVMLKVSTANDNWLMYDNKRGVDVALFANLNNAEDSYVGRMVFNSNGFTLNTTDAGWNGSGQTYIYLAIA